MAPREQDVLQAVAAALTGVALPQIVSLEVLWWLIVATAACSFADMGVTAAKGRGRLALRFAASVAVTMAASNAIAKGVVIYRPEWHGHADTLRTVAALVVGVGLHRALAAFPDAAADVWGVAMSFVRKKLGVGNVD